MNCGQLVVNEQQRLARLATVPCKYIQVCTQRDRGWLILPSPRTHHVRTRSAQKGTTRDGQADSFFLFLFLFLSALLPGVWGGNWWGGRTDGRKEERKEERKADRLRLVPAQLRLISNAAAASPGWGCACTCRHWNEIPWPRCFWPGRHVTILSLADGHRAACWQHHRYRCLLLAPTRIEYHMYMS